MFTCFFHFKAERSGTCADMQHAKQNARSNCTLGGRLIIRQPLLPRNHVSGLNHLIQPLKFGCIKASSWDDTKLCMAKTSGRVIHNDGNYTLAKLLRILLRSSCTKFATIVFASKLLRGIRRIRQFKLTQNSASLSRLVPKSSKQCRFHRRCSVSPLLYMMFLCIRQLLDDVTMQGRSPAGSVAWVTRQVRMFHQRCAPSTSYNDVQVKGVHHEPTSNLSLANFALGTMRQTPWSFCISQRARSTKTTCVIDRQVASSAPCLAWWSADHSCKDPFIS